LNLLAKPSLEQSDRAKHRERTDVIKNPSGLEPDSNKKNMNLAIQLLQTKLKKKGTTSKKA
jgi:hypothetical protein